MIKENYIKSGLLSEWLSVRSTYMIKPIAIIWSCLHAQIAFRLSARLGWFICCICIRHLFKSFNLKKTFLFYFDFLSLDSIQFIFCRVALIALFWHLPPPPPWKGQLVLSIVINIFLEYYTVAHNWIAFYSFQVSPSLVYLPSNCNWRPFRAFLSWTNVFFSIPLLLFVKHP